MQTVASTLQPLLDRPEAAQALKISLRMLDKVIKDKDIPAVRIGKRVLLSPAAIQAFIEQREGKSLQSSW